MYVTTNLTEMEIKEIIMQHMKNKLNQNVKISNFDIFAKKKCVSNKKTLEPYNL